MLILELDRGRTAMIIKRGVASGFADIDTELYYIRYMDKTLMLFGDVTSFTSSIVKEFGVTP